MDCVACYESHRGVQQLFPIGPPFVPDTLSTSTMSEGQNAKRVLNDANQVWESAYGHKFSDVIP